MRYKLKYAVFTDRGDRDINEDSVGVYENEQGSLCILCDGLGGHGMGDAASSLVVQVFESQFRKNIRADRFLAETFMASQDILLADQIAKNAKRKMKTTAVALVTDGKYAYIGHIGDSRLYIFKDGKVMKRTLDHSIPQMLVLSGELDESEIRNHPDRSTILRVLGIEWDEPMYELMAPVPLKKCDAFLLCSDGFWELIDESQMCSLLETSSSPEEWLESMQKTVKKNGEGKDMDNYSAVAVRVVKE